MGMVRYASTSGTERRIYAGGDATTTQAEPRTAKNEGKGPEKGAKAKAAKGTDQVDKQPNSMTWCNTHERACFHIEASASHRMQQQQSEQHDLTCNLAAISLIVLLSAAALSSQPHQINTRATMRIQLSIATVAFVALASFSPNDAFAPSSAFVGKQLAIAAPLRPPRDQQPRQPYP